MTNSQPEEICRCPWCKGFDAYVRYHDTEWGVPVYSDTTHFEFLVLESAQAGLSWATILKKREGYKRAFAGFDYSRVAEFTDSDVESLLQDESIVRNRLKIAATIDNARRFLEVQREYGSFSNYIWDFMGGKPVQNQWALLSEVPPKTDLSDKMAKDMKKRGFKFLGSTTLYAYMQATGLVNDHLIGCFRYEEVKALARR